MSAQLQISDTQRAETLKRRKKYQLKGFEKTLTIQSEKQNCCINNIMSKYRKTGLIDHIRNTEGRYENVADAPTFQEAMNTVAEATESFDLLPSEIRARFHNDTAEFLAFVKDETNTDELVKLGLAEIKSTAPTAQEALADNIAAIAANTTQTTPEEA